MLALLLVAAALVGQTVLAEPTCPGYPAIPGRGFHSAQWNDATRVAVQQWNAAHPGYLADGSQAGCRPIPPTPTPPPVTPAPTPPPQNGGVLPPPPGYERAVAALPRRHWALVRAWYIDRDSGGQARRADMSIHLTPYRNDSQLHHEVGHIVMYANPDIERDWQRDFWPDGKIRFKPVSNYAKTNYKEDFSETYEELLQHGHLDEQPEREQWMRSRVFRAGELP